MGTAIAAAGAAWETVFLDGNTPWEPEIPAITEAELTSLDDRDREMLRSILKLEVTTVREIMVPRLDMAVVEAEAPLEEVAELIVSRGHSRLPVYEETIDRVLGIVYARDVLAALAQPGLKPCLRDLVRSAFIIPETKRVDDLLEEFQERPTQIAVVVDEYGGTEGLVTIEDVLEEIVGEIEDEFSRTRESQVVRQDDGAVLVDARMTTEARGGTAGRQDRQPRSGYYRRAGLPQSGTGSPTPATCWKRTNCVSRWYLSWDGGCAGCEFTTSAIRSRNPRHRWAAEAPGTNSPTRCQ